MIIEKKEQVTAFHIMSQYVDIQPFLMPYGKHGDFIHQYV